MTTFLTRDSAVGLDFQFAVGDGHFRHIVHWGHGVYPRRLTAEGEDEYYDEDHKRPKVDTARDRGIDGQFTMGRGPDATTRPDLLVAHIGSIQKEEFDTLDADRDEGEWYYANHLGMLGTLTLLDKLAPHSAIISEFGAELKSFYIELVNKIGEALRDKQSADRRDSLTQVFPGELTMVYYIAKNEFLCHEDSKSYPAAELTCHSSDEWKVHFADGKTPSVDRNTERQRAHLSRSRNAAPRADERGIREYYENRFEHKLPHFKGTSGAAAPPAE